MLNKFPLWKNALVLLVVLVGAIYALPNLYPDDPAVQISHESQPVVESDLDRITSALDEAGVDYFGVELNDNAALIRLNNLDAQLAARRVIEDTLGTGYVVALNLAPTTPQWLQAIGATKMNLGLDLQGGVHFLMEVDMEEALERRMENTLSNIRRQLREERLRSSGLSLEEGNRIELRFADEQARSQARSLISDNFADLQIRGRETGGDYVLDLTLPDQAVQELQQDTIDANRTSIRSRVDSLGVSEPVIRQQGQDRIVVQLPGVQDTAQAKRVLQRIASLEFHLEAESGASPAEYTEYQYQGRTIPVDDDVILQGDRIANVRSTLDQNGMPQVQITLDAQGAEQFNEITRENVGRNMDILLTETRTRTVMEENENGEMVEVQESYEERRLISHAVIRQPLGRQFVITGLSQREANELSLLIRSGALAAPMYFVEERTIGPSLGQENIRQGSMAVYLGFALVLAFMLVYYRIFGVAANIALAVNLVLLVAIMSIISATLTLPGIFGIVLTVGMAVDANVLIFTRIREELAAGLSPQNAIAAGFDRAFSTILDANLTTFLVAMVLFTIGTGPVKGFSVTLMIGILTSMFTAIMVTRALINLIYGGRRVENLSIGGLAIKA